MWSQIPHSLLQGGQTRVKEVRLEIVSWEAHGNSFTVSPAVCIWRAAVGGSPPVGPQWGNSSVVNLAPDSIASCWAKCPPWAELGGWASGLPGLPEDVPRAPIIAAVPPPSMQQ